MIRIVLSVIAISIATSQVQLYIDSQNGIDPSNCTDYTITSCTKSYPCKALGCTLKYANATLRQNQKQNLEITLIAPSNPLENNYTLGDSNKNSEFWLNFNGSFTLTSDLNLQPTAQACSQFPLLSLQNYMKEYLYIKAINGTIFQYINIEVVLANQPLVIYDYGFIMREICININKTNMLNFLPYYHQYEEAEEDMIALYDARFNSLYVPYMKPKYKMLLLKSNSQFVSNFSYNFSNIMITYNSTEFKYCGSRDQNVQAGRCYQYSYSGLIDHQSTFGSWPVINVTNITIDCPQKPYMKFFYSKMSNKYAINGLTTNCISGFDISSLDIKIENVNADYNLFNRNNMAVQSGVLFDLKMPEKGIIQNVNIKNFYLSVCFDLPKFKENYKKQTIVNSFIIINSDFMIYRLLEQQKITEKFSQDKQYWNSDSYENKWYKNNNIVDTKNNNDINIKYNIRINQQKNSSKSILPNLSELDLTLYPNITGDPNLALNPDYTSYVVNKYKKWLSSISSKNVLSWLKFSNITISSNTIIKNNNNNPVNCFSFISLFYDTYSQSTYKNSYIFENITYSNNTAIDHYQSYALILYDSYKYYIKNVTFIKNNNVRFVMIGNPLRQKARVDQYIKLEINNINISTNYYNLENNPPQFDPPKGYAIYTLASILPEINDGEPIDDNLGIIDINGYNEAVKVTFSNITISNNILILAKIINIKNNLRTYQYLGSCTYLSNATIMNNTFTTSTLLTATGTNIYIENITFNDNIMQSGTSFDLSSQDYQFNSFILQNSTFHNNTLSQSYFIRKEISLNAALKSLKNSISTKELPFWITLSNCTFDELNLLNNSAAIEFTSMPFAFVYNNTFTNINISESSTLIQGSNFVDSLIDMPSLVNYIPNYIKGNHEMEEIDILNDRELVDQYSSQIFQSSMDLLKISNIYSDLNLTNSSNQPLINAFVTRIAYNTFNEIYINLSVALQFQVSKANFMLISIDHNIINNMTLSDYLDNFAKFDSVNLIGLAQNSFIGMSGLGYIIQISAYSNVKISNNYMINNNGSSFIRMNSDNPIQTIINNNMIYNIEVSYTFIVLEIEYNGGIILLDNNIFYNIYLKAGDNAFQSFNLIYAKIGASNSATNKFQLNNNSYVNIKFIKDHELIKQFTNSLLFLSNPEELLQFQSNLFHNISILYDDNLLKIITNECYFYNNTLTLIHNYDTAGSLDFLGKFINITQCNFQYNFAYHGYGGAIYIDYDQIDNPSTSVMLVSNIFRNNFALSGSSFYYGGAYIAFNAQDNHFYRGNITNFDKEYNSIKLDTFLGEIAFYQASLNNSLIINSTTLYSVDNQNQYIFLAFSNISANANILVQVSSLYIIASNDSFSVTQIINCSQVQFSLTNISINIEAVNHLPVGLLLADSGNITISGFNLSFLSGYAPLVQLLCNLKTNTSVTIINSSITNYLVPILDLSFGIIHISSGGSSNSCFQTLNIINSTIEKAVVEEITDWTKDFSAIYVDYPGNINILISQSKFQDIASARGPAINLNNWPIPPNTNSSISNSTVESNNKNNETNSSNIQNDTSPALRTVTKNTNNTYNVYVAINNCVFSNNSAYLEGGAIYNTYNNLSITNTNFSSNQAQYRTGAAIFSLNTNSLIMIQNISSNNIFLYNKRYSQKNDGKYADNAPLGSPPISMNLTILKSATSYLDIINFTSNNSFMIKNVSSYDLSSLTFIVGLFDFLGQIFYESPNGDKELSPTLTNNRMLEILTNTSSSISVNCDFVNCYISSTTLILKGMAGSLLPINIKYLSNESIVPNLVIESILRSCMVGEINSSQIQGGDSTQSICTLCTINSYSLSLNDSSCSECNFGTAANCSGGMHVIISPGYWRKNNLSNVIYECLNPTACLGGFDSECAYGYTGPLCQSCNALANFARSGVNECANCPSKVSQSLITIGYMVLVIVYQIYIIRSTLLENFAIYQNTMTSVANKAKTQGQYVRLLTTYTQIVSIVLTFQLEYPSFFHKTIGTVTSNPINSIFSSTICFVTNLGYNPESIIFYKIALISALPFIKLIILSFIEFIILHTCRRQIDPALKKAYYFVTIFCIIIIDQPALFNNLVSFLTCIQIGNEGPYYLLSDYGVECYTPSYNSYLFFFVLPSILIWGFAIPTILLIIMFRYRKNLSNKFLRLNLGGIYNEYTDKAYYWGIVLMVTKLLLMLSTAVLYNDTKTEAMTVFIILCMYLVSNRYIRPIKKIEIDRAELMATSSYLITIFFALYYKDNRYPLCEIFAIVILTVVNFFVISFLVFKIIRLNINSLVCIKKYLYSPKQLQRIPELLSTDEIIIKSISEKTEEKKDTKNDENNNEENYNSSQASINSRLEIDLESPIARKITIRYIKRNQSIKDN